MPTPTTDRRGFQPALAPKFFCHANRRTYEVVVPRAGSESRCTRRGDGAFGSVQNGACVRKPADCKCLIQKPPLPAAGAVTVSQAQPPELWDLTPRASGRGIRETGAPAGTGAPADERLQCRTLASETYKAAGAQRIDFSGSLRCPCLAHSSAPGKERRPSVVGPLQLAKKYKHRRKKRLF